MTRILGKIQTFFTHLITKKAKCSVKNPSKGFQALMLFASESVN
jgi:hypothetical protein